MGNYISTKVSPDCLLVDNYREFVSKLGAQDRESLRTHFDTESHDVIATLHRIRRTFERYGRRNETYEVRQRIDIASSKPEHVAILFFVAMFPEQVKSIGVRIDPAADAVYVHSVLAILLRFMPWTFRVCCSEAIDPTYELRGMQRELLVFSILTDSAFDSRATHEQLVFGNNNNNNEEFGFCYSINNSFRSNATKGLDEKVKFENHVEPWPTDVWIDATTAFLSDYALENRIGDGAYGEVIRIDNFPKFGNVACKRYKKKGTQKTWRNNVDVTDELEMWLYLQDSRLVSREAFEKNKGAFKVIPLYALYTFVSKKSKIEYIVAVMPLMDGSVYEVKLGNDIVPVKTASGRTVAPLKVRKSICIGMAEAVNFMYDKGVLHLDMKTPNFLYCTDPNVPDTVLVFIADFGCSEKCRVDPFTGKVYFDFPNGHSGTYYYQAPEINRFHMECDPVIQKAKGEPVKDRFKMPVEIQDNAMATEVYALAVCIWEVLRVSPFVTWAPNQQDYEIAYNSHMKRMQDAENTFNNLPDFIRQSLSTDPNARLTIREIVTKAREYYNNQ